MGKKLLLFCCMLISYIFSAQQLEITGSVTNHEKLAVENATVYLLRQKDSSIINYTSTNNTGKFSLKVTPQNEPSMLKIDADKLISYSKIFDKIDQQVSLGNIELENNTVHTIEEVKLSVAPVKIKKDTIEFNASSIKIRPDSKIEELLKQIPGVEISNEGKIMVNGKEADQIMINGKPFFDKDGKIALQNLPADLIKNIQFTTTKTKEEELTGKTAKSKNTTINFNIDEKKNKGLISRITAGYGSDKRYEGSALISYFKKDTKISLLASSNNINSRGFSNNEIFDSMGNGRNAWMMQGGSIMSSGGTTYYMPSGDNLKGIQRSTVVGFNYNDKLGKDIDLDAFSLMYNDNNLKTRSKASRSTLLPDSVLKTNSESDGETENRQYSFDTSSKVKIDSLTSFYFSPSFSHTKSYSTGNSASSTFRNNEQLNENTSFTRTDSENNSFNPNIYFSKKFRKKGRVMYSNISSNISESKDSNLNRSKTVFYQSADPDDIRNQLTQNKSQSNNSSFSAGYTEPVSDSATVSLNVGYSSKISRNTRNVNDFNAITGDYSAYNALLSNLMNQNINQFSPELLFDINKKKITVWGSAKLDVSDMKVNSVFNGQQTLLTKSFVLPSHNMSIQYNFSENKSLNLYSYSYFDIPTAQQLTPYTDYVNPLIVYQGNPDLKNTWNTEVFLNFYNYNILKNINYYANASFNYRNNDIVNYSYYDSSGKQLVTYANISGNKNANFGGGISKTFKWKENKLTIGPKFNMNYAYNKGFINNQVYSSQVYSITPALGITYEIKDKITLKPSYYLAYQFSDYTHYSIDQVKTTNQSLKLEMTNYILKSRLVLGNDFEYNTSSNIAPGFKRDFYFWNTSIGYSFFDKQLTAKVKVYDVLNQNQSVRRVISQAYFEDREDLILKRYIMFSLSMKLNKFAGKKVKT